MKVILEIPEYKFMDAIFFARLKEIKIDQIKSEFTLSEDIENQERIINACDWLLEYYEDTQIKEN